MQHKERKLIGYMEIIQRKFKISMVKMVTAAVPITVIGFEHWGQSPIMQRLGPEIRELETGGLSGSGGGAYQGFIIFCSFWYRLKRFKNFDVSETETLLIIRPYYVHLMKICGKHEALNKAHYDSNNQWGLSWKKNISFQQST